MKIKFLISLILISLTVTSCGGFKAKRVDANESDEKAMEITDKWVNRDTELTVKKILKQIEKHRGFQRYLKKHRKQPKIFISEVQNRTSNAYFPIEDFNDELLNEFSQSGEFILIDASARDKVLKEIQYQNDGMVSAREVKSIGNAAGADLLVFGAVRMKPKSRDGKTIKEYSINIRMTDLERGVEVLRTRAKVQKYSEKSSGGW
jgi:penicillin-binding protein activator